MAETTPPLLATTGLKVGDLDALLFYPGVVPEVEHSVAFDVAHIHRFGWQTDQMVLEHLVGICVVESAAVVLAHDSFAVGVVEVTAVGGHAHDHVVGAEVHRLRRGDRSQRVADR